MVERLTLQTRKSKLHSVSVDFGIDGDVSAEKIVENYSQDSVLQNAVSDYMSPSREIVDTVHGSVPDKEIIFAGLREHVLHGNQQTVEAAMQVYGDAVSDNLDTMARDTILDLFSNPNSENRKPLFGTIVRMVTDFSSYVGREIPEDEKDAERIRFGQETMGRIANKMLEENLLHSEDPVERFWSVYTLSHYRLPDSVRENALHVVSKFSEEHKDNGLSIGGSNVVLEKIRARLTSDL